MLGAHPGIEMAVDPLFPLFRSLRNALVRHSGDPVVQALSDPSAPLQDYYFTADRIRVLDAIQAGELDVPFDDAEREVLQEQLAARAGIESPHLAERLRALRGATYRELFDECFRTISDEGGAAAGDVVGTKEVWVIEFFAALRHEYPDLRLIVVQRDPRAIVASNLGMARTDPAQVAHVVSFARHWRKQEAFVAHYRANPELAGSLLVVRYEHVLSDPRGTAEAVCAFLGIPVDPAMIDPTAYRGADGGVWTANTSFESSGPGIRPELAERWRRSLPPTTVALVELVCGAEMEVAGYEPVSSDGGARPGSDVLADIVDANSREWSWRSDLGDPRRDFDCEVARRAMIEDADTPLHAAGTREAFLFPEALADLRGAA
jgi:Sulfotransferase family